LWVCGNCVIDYTPKEIEARLKKKGLLDKREEPLGNYEYGECGKWL